MHYLFYSICQYLFVYHPKDYAERALTEESRSTYYSEASKKSEAHGEFRPDEGYRMTIRGMILHIRCNVFESICY